MSFEKNQITSWLKTDHTINTVEGNVDYYSWCHGELSRLDRGTKWRHYVQTQKGVGRAHNKCAIFKRLKGEDIKNA